MTQIYSFLFILLVTASCHRTPADQSDQIVSMQLIDKNGFSETISIKDRLAPYQSIDFLTPQPYQKVLRVYGRNALGQSSSRITSYHPNGHVWQSLEVVDGRAHGTYREWYPNGQLRIESHIMEGLADINDLAQTSWVFDKKSQVWDDQGNVIAEIYYDKGLLHRPSIYYHQNGQISQIIPYEKGEIHGESIAYDENGRVLETIPYVRGKKHGIARGSWSPTLLAYEETYNNDLLLSAVYRDPSGEKIGEIVDGNGMKPLFKQGLLASRIEFQQGVQQGIVKEYSPDGSLTCSYHVLDGKKHGEEWEYYPSSTTPKLNLHWHEDQIEGQVKTWYENGILESQREIHQQKKQGLCFGWYKNGDIMLAEEYANDLLIKGSYFKKGDKKPISKIEEGNGLATLYTSEGIFWKKIPYEKGRPSLDDDLNQK